MPADPALTQKVIRIRRIVPSRRPDMRTATGPQSFFVVNNKKTSMLSGGARVLRQLGDNPLQSAESV
jgi:hypothetical protein